MHAISTVSHEDSPLCSHNPPSPQLAQLDVEAIVWTKQLIEQPPLSSAASSAAAPSDDAGPCTVERRSHPQFSILDRFLSRGCSVRTVPSAWNGHGAPSSPDAGACPLKAGAKLPCWALWVANDAGGFEGASGAARFHGCERQTPAESAAAASPTPSSPRTPGLFDWRSPTLSDVATSEGGEPPPNRYCHTIFPPEWRAKDWYVEGWAEGQLPGRNPWTTYIAGYVLVWAILFMPCGNPVHPHGMMVIAMQSAVLCITLACFWALLASFLPPGRLRDSEEAPSLSGATCGWEWGVGWACDKQFA